MRVPGLRGGARPPPPGIEHRSRRTFSLSFLLLFSFSFVISVKSVRFDHGRDEHGPRAGGQGLAPTATGWAAIQAWMLGSVVLLPGNQDLGG